MPSTCSLPASRAAAILPNATVLRGLMGFGPTSKIQPAKILRLSQDLPIVVDIVDTLNRLERYLELVAPTIQGGMVTPEKATVRVYKRKG